MYLLMGSAWESIKEDIVLLFLKLQIRLIMGKTISYW
jgi:hypothetical protein